LFKIEKNKKIRGKRDRGFCGIAGSGWKARLGDFKRGVFGLKTGANQFTIFGYRSGIEQKRGFDFWAKNGVGRIVVTIDFKLKMGVVLNGGFLGILNSGSKMRVGV
jgi:hypothetical protein